MRYSPGGQRWSTNVIPYVAPYETHLELSLVVGHLTQVPTQSGGRRDLLQGTGSNTESYRNHGVAGAQAPRGMAATRWSEKGTLGSRWPCGRWWNLERSRGT